jgi:uncharacterized DUF497 family protein
MRARTGQTKRSMLHRFLKPKRVFGDPNLTIVRRTPNGEETIRIVSAREADARER